MKKKFDLEELSSEIHGDNVVRGFYDSHREVGTLLMLIVSELSEALEADRKNRSCETCVIDEVYNELEELNELENKRPDEFSLEEVQAKRAQYAEHFKEKVKDTYEDEIADTFILLFDLVGYQGIAITKHIMAKLAFNRTRGYKHGKNY